MEAPPRNRVLLALAAVYLLWGSTYLAIRYAVETIPPFFMMAFRSAAAGAILHAWARARGAPPAGRRHWLQASGVGALFFLGGHGTLAWAEQRVPSASAALLIATVPLWVVFLEWALRGGEPLQPRVLAGMFAGVLGVALLVRPGSQPMDPMGASLLLLAALFWATGSVVARRAALPDSGILAASLQLLTGGVLLLLAGLMAGELQIVMSRAVSLRSLAALAFQIGFGSILAFTAYLWLLRVTTPARATSYAFVNPLVAVVLGWAAGDEEPTLATGLGAVAIVTAVALVFTSLHGRKLNTTEVFHDRTRLARNHGEG